MSSQTPHESSKNHSSSRPYDSKQSKQEASSRHQSYARKQYPATGANFNPNYSHHNASDYKRYDSKDYHHSQRSRATQNYDRGSDKYNNRQGSYKDLPPISSEYSEKRNQKYGVSKQYDSHNQSRDYRDQDKQGYRHKDSYQKQKQIINERASFSSKPYYPSERYSQSQKNRQYPKAESRIYQPSENSKDHRKADLSRQQRRSRSRNKQYNQGQSHYSHAGRSYYNADNRDYPKKDTYSTYTNNQTQFKKLQYSQIKQSASKDFIVKKQSHNYKKTQIEVKQSYSLKKVHSSIKDVISIEVKSKRHSSREKDQKSRKQKLQKSSSKKSKSRSKKLKNKHHSSRSSSSSSSKSSSSSSSSSNRSSSSSSSRSSSSSDSISKSSRSKKFQNKQPRQFYSRNYPNSKYPSYPNYNHYKERSSYLTQNSGKNYANEHSEQRPYVKYSQSLRKVQNQKSETKNQAPQRLKSIDQVKNMQKMQKNTLQLPLKLNEVQKIKQPILRIQTLNDSSKMDYFQRIDQKDQKFQEKKESMVHQNLQYKRSVSDQTQKFIRQKYQYKKTYAENNFQRPQSYNANRIQAPIMPYQHRYQNQIQNVYNPEQKAFTNTSNYAGNYQNQRPFAKSSYYSGAYNQNSSYQPQNQYRNKGPENQHDNKSNYNRDQLPYQASQNINPYQQNQSSYNPAQLPYTANQISYNPNVSSGNQPVRYQQTYFQPRHFEKNYQNTRGQTGNLEQAYNPLYMNQKPIHNQNFSQINYQPNFKRTYSENFGDRRPFPYTQNIPYQNQNDFKDQILKQQAEKEELISVQQNLKREMDLRKMNELLPCSKTLQLIEKARQNLSLASIKPNFVLFQVFKQMNKFKKQTLFPNLKSNLQSGQQDYLKQKQKVFENLRLLNLDDPQDSEAQSVPISHTNGESQKNAQNLNQIGHEKAQKMQMQKQSVQKMQEQSKQNAQNLKSSNKLNQYIWRKPEMSQNLRLLKSNLQLMRKASSALSESSRKFKLKFETN